jgi:hypothetical protein
MSKLNSLPLLLAALVPSFGFAQAPNAGPPSLPPELRAQLVRLGGQLMIDGQAYEYDRVLADDIGPRLTASSNFEKAVDWSEGEFKRLGLANVHTETWTIPSAWEPETDAVAHILKPHLQRLHLESEGWGPSTPASGVRGEVYLLPKLSVAAVHEHAGAIKGHIVMVTPEAFGDGELLFGQLFDALDAIGDVGASGLLLGMGTTNNAPSFLGVGDFAGRASKLPTANVGREDTLLIGRLLDKGPVEIEFSFRNRVRANVAVKNVVADIPGTDPDAGYVVVGGHLDSWHPGTGAEDNGTGAASVMAVAQAVEAVGLRPRRTLRFILFGGEEEGLLGSLAYAHAHEQEMSKCAGVFVTDSGSEPPKGWLTFGREDVSKALAPLKPLLEPLDAGGIDDGHEIIFETDHAPFLVRGIPAFVLWTPFDKYEQLHHKPSDTFDKVDHRDLNLGAAVVGLSAYYFASAQEIPGHLDNGKMEETLKSIKAYNQYKDLVDHKMMP